VRGGGAWAPRPGMSWQIQLTGPLDPAADADVYDLDVFATARDTVLTLRAAGKRVVCHVDVGLADSARPDYARFPPAVLGAAASSTARHVDIRDWAALAPIIGARVDLCRAKGFEAVDADATSTYLARSGFPIGRGAQVAFDKHVIALVRGVPLAVAVRTPPALVDEIAPLTDFAVTRNCFARRVCTRFFDYIDQEKAVFDVETAGPATAFCGLARAYGFAAIRKDRALGAYTRACPTSRG
jgi:hypothetical protein